MKKILFVCALLLTTATIYSQNVGIGTTTPDVSSQLDVSSTSKGMLIPRMNMNQRNTIVSPATGLLIYQTDNTPGFYFFNGTAWVAIASNTGWNLTGNTGTNASNFIGTTDDHTTNNPLRFVVNNGSAGIVDSLRSNTAIGLAALRGNVNGIYNTAIGTNALLFNTDGYSNTASGTYSLYHNTTGINNTANGEGAVFNNSTGSGNTASGQFALYYNTTGSNNTASGVSSLHNNTIGNYNTAIGSGALFKNATGSGNTIIGSYADVASSDLSYATAIGSDAIVSQSNSLVLGKVDGAGTSVGIGTTAPSERLEVVGNIKLSGEVNRPTTGAANLVPICYGTVNGSGVVQAGGSGNFTASKILTGLYQVTITGVNYYYTMPAIVTPIDTVPVTVVTNSGGGNLLIRTFDKNGAAVDAIFSFVVYEP